MARRLRLMVASGVVALLGLTPTATHGADPIQVTLPIGGYFDMVVDETHQHIFVTGDPSRDNVRVLVIDYHGNVVKIIRNEPGASGLALDPTSSTVYVSLQTTSAIAAIDTVTLTETARFPVAPDAGCPGYATFIEPRVWFGFKCGSGSNVVGIGSLDPTTGSVRAFSGSGYPSSNPIVRTSPALTDTLFAAPHSPGRGSTIDKYQINGDGSLQLLASADPGAGYLYDLRVTSDGLDVLAAACVGGEYSPAYRTSDLSLDLRYYSGCPPSAIAATEDGAVVVTAWFECGSTDLFFHHRHDEDVYRVFAIPPPPPYLFDGGLTFNETGSLLFTVGSNLPQKHPYFTVVPHPTLGKSNRKPDEDMMPKMGRTP